MPVITVRRKPTTNRALPWTGHNVAEARAFLGNDFAGVHGTTLLIRTLEHPNVPFEAPPGSVVLEGAVHGEHWAVAAAQYADTYEPAEPDADARLAASEREGAHARLLAACDANLTGDDDGEHA